MNYTRTDLQRRFGCNPSEIKIDLGCGSRKRDGYIGVDVVDLAGVDIVCNLEQRLPFDDDSIDDVYASYFIEHVGDIVKLIRELYRVCRDGALLEIKVPYYQSVTQFKDPTHRSFFMPEMIRYFGSDDWYGSDYGINTNITLVNVEYHYLPPFDRLMSPGMILIRPFILPVVIFARRYLWNVVHSITMNLKIDKKVRE